jgi:hypothetical protein
MIKKGLEIFQKYNFDIDRFHTPRHIISTLDEETSFPLSYFISQTISRIYDMTLLSLEELSRELSVPLEFITELIKREIITPYGGKARLGEPRFSAKAVPELRDKINSHIPQSAL